MMFAAQAMQVWTGSVDRYKQLIGTELFFSASQHFRCILWSLKFLLPFSPEPTTCPFLGTVMPFHPIPGRSILSSSPSSIIHPYHLIFILFDHLNNI